MNEITKIKSIIVGEQPNHDPRQVRNVDELKVGREYFEYHATEKPSRIRILSEPEGDMVKVEVIVSDGRVFESKRYLTDMCVVPYDTGWNKDNYLVPVGED